MIKKFNNITHKSLDTCDLKETYLSIQISLDGFSFCIYHCNTKKHIALIQYELQLKTNTPENHLKKIETIFEENLLLQQSYKSIFVTHQNELATVVPLEYFHEDNLTTYLNNTLKTLPNDYITYDTLKHTEANVVYIPFVNINNYLFTKYGAFEYYHSASLFIDKMLQASMNSESSKMCIQVFNNRFELIVVKSNKLIFYNSFDFITSADFIYYILFTMEQLNLNPEEINTLLFGAIEKESELFIIAFQYIRNIAFYSEENTKLTKEFELLSKHSNYTLLNQF